MITISGESLVWLTAGAQPRCELEPNVPPSPPASEEDETPTPPPDTPPPLISPLQSPSYYHPFQVESNFNPFKGPIESPTYYQPFPVEQSPLDLFASINQRPPSQEFTSPFMSHQPPFNPFVSSQQSPLLNPFLSSLQSPDPFIQQFAFHHPYEYHYPFHRYPHHTVSLDRRYRIFSPTRPRSSVSVYDNVDLPHDLPYYRNLLIPLASSEECSLSLFSSSLPFFSPLSSPSITREFIYLSRAPLASPDPSTSFTSSPLQMKKVGHWVYHPPSESYDGYLDDVVTYPTAVPYQSFWGSNRPHARLAPLARSESCTSSRLSSLSWGTASDSLFNSTEASFDLPAFSDSGIAFQSFYSQLQQLQQEGTVLQLLQPSQETMQQRVHSIVLLEPQKEMPQMRWEEIKDQLIGERLSERSSLDIPFIDDSDVSRDLWLFFIARTGVYIANNCINNQFIVMRNVCEWVTGEYGDPDMGGCIPAMKNRREKECTMGWGIINTKTSYAKLKNYWKLLSVC